MKVCYSHVKDDSAPNVPDDILKARAAEVDLSLSDFLLVEIKESLERRTLAELREHLQNPQAGAYSV